MKKWSSIISALCTLSLLATGTTLSVSAATIGDVDSDGTVSAVDASLILMKAAQIGAGEVTATGEDLSLMDVNADGMVNAIDASLLLKYAAQSGATGTLPPFSEYVAQRTQAPTYDGAKYVSMIHGDIYRAFTGDTSSTSAYTHVLITSSEELETFVNTMNGISGYYDVRTSTDTENESISLTDTVAKYDESWFQEHDLIMVIAIEQATAIYHNVQGITENADGSWTVSIDRNIPMASDASTPSFAIFVETNKAVEFASSVNVEMTNVYLEQ